jgi:hypothetical protein
VSAGFGLKVRVPNAVNLLLEVFNGGDTRPTIGRWRIRPSVYLVTAKTELHYQEVVNYVGAMWYLIHHLNSIKQLV